MGLPGVLDGLGYKILLMDDERGTPNLASLQFLLLLVGHGVSCCNPFGSEQQRSCCVCSVDESGSPQKPQASDLSFGQLGFMGDTS